MPVIHSISFDSTEEELVVTAPSAAATSAEAATSSTTTATAAPSGGGAKAGGHSAAGVSLCPTSAMKRQSYRNMLDSRFNKTSFNTLQYPSSPTTAARTHRSLSPVAAALATVVQSSFDSIDTVETSASSTDASRFGHVTTSFESSATVDTTTDEATTGPYAIKGNAEDGVESSSHQRLMFSSRGDSGYRSLEMGSSQQRSQWSEYMSPMNISGAEDGMADQVPLEPIEGATANYCQCPHQQHDDKCERNKPIIFARCTRYRLTKNRSMSASTSSAHVPGSFTPGGSVGAGKLAGWKKRMTPVLTRDYSIDERTDALFREFSRCDPVYDDRSAGHGNDDAANGKDWHRYPASHLRHCQVGSSLNKRWHQRHEQRRKMFTSLQCDAPSTASDSSDTLLHFTPKE